MPKPDSACAHIAAITTVKQPKRLECEECVKIGARWVHFRTCQQRGRRSVPTEGVGWWPHATPPAEVDDRALVLFDHGDEVVLQGGESGIRFLLVSGQTLQEPEPWYGPIVMNTQAELQQAFDELEQGTFLKQDQR